MMCELDLMESVEMAQSKDVTQRAIARFEGSTDLALKYQILGDAFHEMEESRNCYAALYDFCPAGMITLNEQGCITKINLTGASLLGREQIRLIGIPLSAFVAAGDCKRFLDHLRSCRGDSCPVSVELKLNGKNPSVQYVKIVSRFFPATATQTSQFQSIMIDITDEKYSENDISRLESLNVIGELAAGIAHEIRNPMTTVRGFLQLFQQKNEFFRFRSQLDLMITELDRANCIITEYLSLAKNKIPDRSPQNLSAIVEALLPLLEADALLHKMVIITELADDLPVLLLDGQEIRQLILNLVRNGLEAMLPGGRLKIRVYEENKKVICSIQDQGSGIQPAILDKLGTPFVTTKENGTGLGLAICYQVASKNNAVIDVATGSKGTTFFVIFTV